MRFALLMSLPPLIVVASACGPSAVVTGIEPTTTRPGRPMTLRGEAFDEHLVVALRRLVDDGTSPPTWTETANLPVTALSETHATFDLPQSVQPGRWILAAGAELPLGPEGPRVPTAGFEVWTPQTDAPCAKHHALDVRTLRMKRTVVVERLFHDGPPERTAWSGDDLEGLLVGRSGECAWVRLTTTDGENPLLFDEAGAHQRAQDLAASLGAVLDLPVRTP